MPKRHLGAIKVEKVHQLDRLALPQGGIVDALGLVVELELDWEDLHEF